MTVVSLQVHIQFIIQKIYVGTYVGTKYFLQIVYTI